MTEFKKIIYMDTDTLVLKVCSFGGSETDAGASLASLALSAEYRSPCARADVYDCLHTQLL